MADDRLRELERAWRTSGALDDEVAWLRERQRAGDLDAPRVRLAAWLGHPAAVQLAPDAGFGPPRAGASGAALFWRGVTAHGEEAAVRALVAEGRRAIGAVRAALDPAAPPTRALSRLRALLAEPGPGVAPAEREAAGWWRAATHAVESATSWALAPGDEARRVLVDDARRVGGGSLPGPLLEARPRPVGAALHDLSRTLDLLGAALGGAPRAPWSGLTGARLEALRATMRAEVAPWALRTGDPLRDELQGRLDRIRIASPCAARWEAMAPLDDRSRRCGDCRLAVHDLAAYTAVEVDALLREHAGRRLCVNLYRRADGRVLTRDCPTGLAAGAAFRDLEMLRGELAR